MHYSDISTDTKSLYHLTKPGVFIFLLKNRSGEITFSIEHPRVKVYVFGIFEGDANDTFSLKTIQKHMASNAESHVLIKSVLRGVSRLTYSGNIIINPTGQQSNASLENKNLLIGDRASAETKPFLEIFADDVQCRHSATTAPINPEHLAYLSSRGIPTPKAEKLLIEGFLYDVTEKIEKLKH